MTKDDYPSFDESRAKKAFYEALMIEASYNEYCGKAVPMKLVDSYMIAVANKLKTQLSQLPDRLSSRCADESDERLIYKLIFREVQQIMDSIEDIETEDYQKEMHDQTRKKPMLNSKGRITTEYRGLE